MPRWIAPAVVAAVCICFASGCACGRFGTLVARRTFTRTAEVVDVYGFGALLRPAGSDAGISLGWRHATYVYPREPGDGAAEGTLWNYGCVHLHREGPFFLVARGLGAELLVFPGFTRLHVGYAEDAFTFAASIGADRAVSFHYRPSRPAATRLVIKPASFPVR